MATDHNFKVKKGLDVLGGDVNLGDGFAYKIDGTAVVDSSRNLTNIPSIRLTNEGDAALTSTSHAFQIGPTSGYNLIIDNNEIMARNNGSAATLYIQNDGGTVHIGANVSTNLRVDGNIKGVTGNTTGKFAVKSTAVHNSYDFYNDGTTYLNGTTEVNAEFKISSSSSYTTHFNHQDNGVNIISQANAGSTSIRNNNGNLFTLSSTGSLSVAQNVIAGNSSSAAIVRAHYNDGSYMSLEGFGLVMNRGASYIRPSTNADKTLYFGGADASLNWSSIHFRSSNGLYMTGTQFLDTSRNLVNIGSIGLSGQQTFGNNTTANRYDIVVGSQTTARGFLIAPYATIGTQYSGWDLWMGTNAATHVGTTSSGVKLATGYTNNGASILNVGFYGMHYYSWSSSQLSGMSANDSLTLGTPKFSVTGGGDVQVGGTTVIDSSRNLTNINSLALTSSITLNNNQRIYFKNSSGTSNSSLYRAGGNATRFQYADNAFIFDAASDTDFEIRQSGDDVVFKVDVQSTVANTSVYTTGNFNAAQNIQTGSTTRITNAGNLINIGSITASGNLQAQNATFTNNVVIGGNLTVNGTQTTLNTATLQVEDKNIVLNYGTGDTSGSADGAGITIQDAVSGSSDAAMTWNAAYDYFNFSHKINIQGDIQAYNVYAQDYHVLNAAGTGWHEWATRSDDRVNLSVHDVSANGTITISSGASSNITFTNSSDSNYNVELRTAYDYDGFFRVVDGGGVVRFAVGRDDHAYLGGAGGSGNKVFHDGYHPNADKWTAARTLSLTGDVTGSVSWDGSGNASITTAVANNSHEHSQLYENGTIDFGASYVQWTDQDGTGGTGMDGAAPRNPTSGWYHNLIFNHGNSGGYYSQIATGLNTSDIYFTRVQNGTAKAWQRIFADDYHPNADKWTTARSHTVTLTGEVTGTATQSVDGTGNKTWSIATTLNNTALDDQYVDVTGDTMTGDLTVGTTTDSTKIVFPDKNISDNPGAAGDKRKLIAMGNGGNGGMWQTTGRGGLMLASADDSLILASGDVGRNHDPDAGGWNPNPDDEQIYLLTDSNIIFRTNLQTVSDYKQMSFDANGDLVVARNISAGGSLKTSGTTRIDSVGNLTNIGSITASGNIQHTGLTMTSGTDIDQIYTAAQTLTITTSYADTGIDASDLATGTYLVQLQCNDHSVGGAYSMIYSGTMSWANNDTNDTAVDEIPLHRAGHASVGKNLFLRVQYTIASDVNNLKLQIRGNYNASGSSTYTFKFRRMI